MNWVLAQLSANNRQGISAARLLSLSSPELRRKKPTTGCVFTATLRNQLNSQRQRGGRALESTEVTVAENSAVAEKTCL